LRYIEGSHLKGLRKHGASPTLGFSQSISDLDPSDLEKEVNIVAEPGDALIHYGNTIHRAGPNGTKDRHRRSFAMVFKGASAQRDHEKFKAYHESSKLQQSSFGIEVNP
jgi:phytanoyl-CoA hydroxylase